MTTLRPVRSAGGRALPFRARYAERDANALDLADPELSGVAALDHPAAMKRAKDSQDADAVAGLPRGSAEIEGEAGRSTGVGSHSPERIASRKWRRSAESMSFTGSLAGSCHGGGQRVG